MRSRIGVDFVPRRAHDRHESSRGASDLIAPRPRTDWGRCSAIARLPVCAQDCVPQTNCFVSSATSSKFFLMSGKDWLPSR
jgi:hypothetical protein